MEQRIKDVYEKIHMPEHCVERIENAMDKKTECKRSSVVWLWPILAGLVLMFGVWVMSNPEVVMAVEGTFAEIVSRLSGNRDNASTRKELEGDSFLADEALNNPVEDPAWEQAWEKIQSIGPVPGRLREKDGRLIFMAGLEMLDITGQFSEEEPFTHVYTDASGLTHYVIIGGTYDPNGSWKRDIGWAEYFYDADLANAEGDPSNGWITGRGQNQWNRETEEYYGWYEKGKEELGVPWK
ncbi:MAG: hypothetical protein J6I64_01820 [Lachnospiraceae bacterium]|nr:hypothetical protein [Lachnospiraceae bacterium]